MPAPKPLSELAREWRDRADEYEAKRTEADAFGDAIGAENNRLKASRHKRFADELELALAAHRAALQKRYPYARWWKSVLGEPEGK